MLHFGVGTAATGAATASSATVSAGIAATAGAGAATEEMWGKMRDSSWKGIQEMYEKGEISEEQIEVFAAIRNLNDEEWTQIKKDYLSGNIGKEEFEAIKQIKEMPEDWTTLENGIKGIFYGISTGAWEGVQWYLGGKLAGWAFKGSKVATSATRIGVDTAFNAMDTPYRTLLDSLATGNTLEESWAARGGWQSMLTDVGIGFIGSTGGEVFDGIKNARNVAKRTGQISDLIDVINTGNVSDPRVMNLMQNSFDDWLGKNNPYAEKLINKLIELKQTYPDLTWEVDANGGSFWSGYQKTLCLGDNQINWGDSGTYAHETGHLLFNLVLGEQLPTDWDNIVAKARVLSSQTNNSQLHRTISSIQNHNSANYSKAMSSFESSVKSAGYKSTNDFVDTWAKSIEDSLNTTGLYDTMQTLRNAGFDEDVIQLLTDPNISPQDVARQYVNTKISVIKESFDRLQDGGTDCAVSDIISSVYEGTRFDLNGNYLDYTYCHSEAYYSSSKINSFHEIIANFTQLKMSGNTKALNELRNIFGDEFYLALEDTFNKLLE